MAARLAAILLLLVPTAGAPQQQDDRGKILLTIFLRHDQSKTLPEIRAQLERTGFMEAFPPAGVEVVSWYVMMGIGQVVTVRLPAERLREVNRIVEEKAWAPTAPTSTRPTITRPSPSRSTRSPRSERARDARSSGHGISLP